MPNTLVFSSGLARPHKQTYSLYARFTHSCSPAERKEARKDRITCEELRGDGEITDMYDSEIMMLISIDSTECGVTDQCYYISCSMASLPHLPFSHLPEFLVFTLDIEHNELCLFPSDLQKSRQETLVGYPIDMENS